MPRVKTIEELYEIDPDLQKEVESIEEIYRNNKLPGGEPWTAFKRRVEKRVLYVYNKEFD